jgi:hypothetical protein
LVDDDDGELKVDRDVNTPEWSQDAQKYTDSFGCRDVDIEGVLEASGFGIDVQCVSLNLAQSTKRPTIYFAGQLLIGSNTDNYHWSGVAIDFVNNVYALFGCDVAPQWIRTWLNQASKGDFRWYNLTDVSPKLGAQIESECGGILALGFKWFACSRDRSLKYCDMELDKFKEGVRNVMLLWRSKRALMVSASSYESKRQLQIQSNKAFLASMNFTPDERAWNERKQNFSNALVAGVQLIVPEQYSRCYVPTGPQDGITYDDTDVAKNLVSEFQTCGAFF